MCMYGISAMSLAEQFNLSVEEAEQIYTDFYNSYPTMKAWFEATNEHANEFGFVQTAWGRKRRFLGHKDIAKKYKILHARIQKITGKEKFNIWKEAKVPRQLKQDYWAVAKEFGRVQRQSVNAIIQGSSADIMKIAMVKLDKKLKELGTDFKMLATVHDEILIELPMSTPIEVIKEIEEVQRTAVNLTIPMKCDVAVMNRWGCEVSLKEWEQGGMNINVFRKI